MQDPKGLFQITIINIDRKTFRVSLVERMLALHKSLAGTKSDPESELLQRQIKSTDRQIDELVYQLYGLTEEEKSIVEGS